EAQQHGKGAVRAPVRGVHDAVHVVQLDAHNLCGCEDLDAKALGLRLQAVSKLSTCDAFREAWEVVEALGHPGLATDTAALDDQGVDALACRVQRSGEAGRA